MRNQNLGIPIKHQSDGVPKEVGDRAVFTVHFLWWLSSSQNQKLNEDTKIKCGVLLMWYTVHHLECTSNSLGATSLWPAGLPKARKIQTYLISWYSPDLLPTFEGIHNLQIYRWRNLPWMIAAAQVVAAADRISCCKPTWSKLVHLVLSDSNILV